MTDLPVPVPGRTAVARVSSSVPDDRNPALVYLARLAPGSRRTMAQALDVVAGVLTDGAADHVGLPWWELRYQHTQAVRAALVERFAPATANKILSALRGVLREAWRLGAMEPEDYQRAADLAAVKGETLPAGRALENGELRSLFASCGEGAAGARDAALLAVLYGGGLRRSEIVALALSDYDSASGELRVRSGKGGRQRMVYATNGGLLALEAWMAVRGDEPGPLFCPVTKGGRVVVRPMTTQAVYGILERRGEAAGVGKFSPHDLRRTFISDLLDAGADIATVQRLAGHASVTTTARYDRRGEAAKRRVASMLHVPYGAKPAPARGERKRSA